MKLDKIYAMLSLIVLAQSSFVQLPVIKKRHDISNEPNDVNEPHCIISNTNKLVKRDDTDATFQLGTKFDQLMYEVELQIGSNKDSVRLLLDTGSSDMVVNSANNQLCLEDGGDQGGTGNQSQALFLSFEAGDDDNYIETNFCIGQVDSDDNVDSNNTLSSIEEPKKVIVSPSTSTTLSFFSSSSSISLFSSPSSDSSSPSPSVYPQLSNTILPDENTGSYGTFAEQIYKSYSCLNYGLFNESASTTLKNLSIPLQMTYLDVSGFDGYFVEDDVYYADTKISNLTFGINVNNYKVTGILGVGFQENESPYQSGSNKYDNFPIQLKNNNLIKKAVYSLYSYSNNYQTSIIFGAYDKNGYVANSGLTLIPIINFSPKDKIGNGPWYLSITLNSISVTNLNNSTNNQLLASGYAPAILDVGSTISTLPYYIFNEIIVKFNFKWSSQLNNYVVNESDISQESTFLTFNFQSADINIPLIYFTYPVIDDDTLSTTGLRVLSITSHDGDYFILGDDFINNVYFVVDLDDKNIALGQINKDKTTDSIVIVEDQIVDAIQTPNWDEIYGYNGITNLRLEEIDNPNNLESFSSKENLDVYIPGTGDLGW